MKRSTMIKGAYEIRRVLCDLGIHLGISQHSTKPEIYQKVEQRINEGLKIFSQDVTDDEPQATLLQRIHGETPAARLTSYMGQQIALLKDFIETTQPEGMTLMTARAHIETYEDCIKAATTILEELPTPSKE